ncbi:reticulocyte binding protein 2b, putative, partial [Plasmodium ovale]
MPSSDKGNRSKPNKIQKGSNLLPLYSNLRVNNKFDYNNEESKNIKNSNNPNEKEYKKINSNMNSVNYVEKPNLSNKTSLISAKDHKSETKPSYHAYIKKNNVYTYNKDNSEDVDESGKSISILNAFIQNPKRKTTVPTPDIIETLDYIDAEHSNKRIISQLQPHYVNINYFSQIKRIMDYHTEISIEYNNIYNRYVLPLKKHVQTDVSKCKPKKNALIDLIKVLQDPEKLKKFNGKYNNKINEYKTKKQDYQNCLISNNNDSNVNIEALMYKSFSMLTHIICRFMCTVRPYEQFVKIFTLEISHISCEPFTNFINNFKKNFDKGVNIVKRAQNHLNNNVIMYSIKFIQEETQYIINRYNTHLTYTKNGHDYIKKRSKETLQTYIPISILKVWYVDLALHYSNIFFGIDNLRSLEKALKIKEQIILNLFTKSEEELKKKFNTLKGSLHNLKNSTLIASKSQEILKYANDVYNSNTKLIEYIANYTNAETENIKRNYSQKIDQLKDILNKIKVLTTSIESTHNLNKSENSKLDKALNKNISKNPLQERCISLLDSIENMKNYNLNISRNDKKMEGDYKSVEELKKKIEELVKVIQKHQEDMEELIEDLKSIKIIKGKIKEKMDYIIKNIGSIEELNTSKETLEEKIKEIEKLISETPFDMNPITEEKAKISGQIKSIITDFYKDNLKALIDSMSNFVKKHIDYETKIYTKDEIDKVLNETTNEHKKIVDLKCENIPHILEKLNTESNNLSKLKSEIMDKRFKHMQTEISNLLDDLKTKHADLLNKTREYKEEKTKIEQYKDIITERVNKLLGGSYDDVNDVSEEKTSYNEFLQNRDSILNKGNTISTDINSLEEKIKDIENKLRSHNYTVNTLKTHATNKYPNIDEFLPNYDKEKEKFKLSQQDEQDFIKDKKTVSNIIEQIQNSKYNIDTIMTINIAISRSGINNASIEQLKKNKNSLTEKIKKHVEEIKNNNLIGKDAKTELESAFNKEIADINDKLSDDSINKLKAQTDEILKYCKETKVNFEKVNEQRLNVSSEKMNWENVEAEISKIKMEYDVINIKVDDLIKANHNEMIKLIHELITRESAEINEKAENYIKSLDEMKTKLDSFDLKKVMKDTTNEKIRKLNQQMNETITKINENINKLNNIKRKSSEHLSKADEEKGKGTFDEKNNKLEEIYKQIKSTSEELNIIESVETTREIVNHAEVEYERILIHDITAQIYEENEKAKNVMEDIESSIEKIKKLKHETLGQTEKEINDAEYKKFYEKSKTHKSEIQQLFEKTNIKKNEADEREKKINEIKDIKQEITSFREIIIREHNAMLNDLKEIKNVNKLLMLNTSKSVADEISKNTEDAETIKEETLKEFKKIKGLIREAEENFDKAKNKKNKINVNLTEEQVNEEVDAIKQITEDIIKKGEEMKKSFAITEQLKEKLSLEINEANRGKNRIDTLQRNWKHNEVTMNDFNMNDVEENIKKCKKFLEEVTSIEKETKEKYDSFLERESINDILNESVILGIRTKSEKRKNEAHRIISEIKEVHINVKEELQKYNEILRNMNDKPDTSILEGVLSNDKSSGAIVTIQSNLDRVKHELSNIEKTENDLDNVLATSTKLMDLLLNVPEISVRSKLEDAQNNEGVYIELLKNIKKQKELLTVEQNKLDVTKKNINDIEQKLEEYKKNYEIGLLERISKIAKQRKVYMDTTKVSLKTSMESFASLFKGFNLEEYDIREHLQDYEKKIEEINNAFESTYKSIQSKVEEALQKSIKYVKAKELREKAQKEEEILQNKEDEAKKFLDAVKEKESLKLIYHMKRKLDNKLQMCKDEYLKVNTVHENIQKFNENMKKLDDEKIASNILEQTENQNREIQNSGHHSYKSEAQTMLNHIANAAKYIDINIVTGLQMSDLNAQVQSREKGELKFEPNTAKKIENKSESKDIMELDVYSNMQNSYQNVLHIFKYSNEIEAKKEQCNKLMNIGKDMLHRIMLINELKRKLINAKSRNSIISINLREAFNKGKNLSNIKCNVDNNHSILEKFQHEKLKELSNSFRQKLSNKENETKLTEFQTSFDKNTKSLGILEKEVEILNAINTNNEEIQKKISSVEEILKELEDLGFQIKQIDSLFNELLKTGKECEVFMYISVKGSINSKITNDVEIINKKKILAQEYLTHVRNSYDSINSDITTLNKYFDAKQVSNYEKTIVDEANALSTKFTEAINELEGKIQEIKDEFTAVNEKAEINDLQNSVEKLKNLYNLLNNKKNSMDEIYKKINLIKLKEIKQSTNKYNDIMEVFNNVITSQKEELLKNKHNMDAVIQILKGKEIELDNADSSFLMESINKFEKINNDVMTNIRKLQELEGYNKSENKKVKVYLDNCLYLIDRNKSLLTDVNNFETNVELIKEYKNVSNDINEDISKTKKEINTLEETLNKLLWRLKENEKLYVNNNEDVFISAILKKIEDIKVKFSKNIPVKEKLFKIKSNLEDIKDIFNAVKGEYDINKFIVNISKNIEDELKRSKGLKNVKEIKNIVGNITNYIEQTKDRLYKVKNELDRIKIKKKEMDDLFKTISTENRNAYDSAKSFVDDSDKIVEELEGYDEKMTGIINKAEKGISELKDEIKKILEEMEKQQREESEKQRQDEINKNVADGSRADEHNLLTTSQEKTQNTTSDSQHEESNDKHHSRASSTDGKTLLAGGI